MKSGFFAELPGLARGKRPMRVAIPLAEDEACAYAVGEGLKAGLVEARLIGNPVRIRELYGDAAKHAAVTIIEEPDAGAACRKAVAMVREGQADLLMKGMVPTSSILKAVLSSTDGLKKNPLLSHLCFFERKDEPGLKILTDAAINIAPDAETLEKVARNAIEAFRAFFPRAPRVALLSANEKVSDKVPSTVLAQAVAASFPNPEDAVVEGPISLDLSVSPESARIKKYQGKIRGDADILVAPRIEVGNVLYKSLQYFADASMGGVVFGARCPVVLTSRSDSNATKYASLLLGLALSNRMSV